MVVPKGANLAAATKDAVVELQDMLDTNVNNEPSRDCYLPVTSRPRLRLGTYQPEGHVSDPFEGRWRSTISITAVSVSATVLKVFLRRHADTWSELCPRCLRLATSARSRGSGRYSSRARARHQSTGQQLRRRHGRDVPGRRGMSSSLITRSGIRGRSSATSPSDVRRSSGTRSRTTRELVRLRHRPIIAAEAFRSLASLPRRFSSRASNNSEVSPASALLQDERRKLLRNCCHST